MIKQETTLCYIKYVGTQSGTAMAKAVKSYAHEMYDKTIIDEYQRNDVVESLKGHAEELAATNPKWKPVTIELHDNTCGGAYLGVKATLYWLRVDGETILTISKANGKFEGCYENI